MRGVILPEFKRSDRADVHKGIKDKKEKTNIEEAKKYFAPFGNRTRAASSLLLVEEMHPNHWTNGAVPEPEGGVVVKLEDGA